MTRETKKTIIAQIHEKHYIFKGKSFRPKQGYKEWCDDNDNTMTISRLNIKDLIYRRDLPVCTKCDCIINDTDEVELCQECWENTPEVYVDDDKVKCWTCDDKCATHKVFRDALNEWEFTCDECYENEYGDDDDTMKSMTKDYKQLVMDEFMKEVKKFGRGRVSRGQNLIMYDSMMKRHGTILTANDRVFYTSV